MPVSLRPLCVDLDGTLVQCDTLAASLLVLARRRPALLFPLLLTLADGKAAFKAFVTEHVQLDVTRLVYNQRVLRFVEEERQRGRAIYLVTGANQALAEQVAAHVGLFSGVFGSSERINRTGNRKLQGLRERLGDGGFDYIGNDLPDLPLLAVAEVAMVANPTLRLRVALWMRRMRPARVFADRCGWLRGLFGGVRR